MTAARHVDVPGGRVLIPFSMFCSVVRVSFLNKTRGWLGYPDSYYKHIRLLDFRVDGVARPEECAYFDPYNSGNPCCLYLLDVQFK